MFYMEQEFLADGFGQPFAFLDLVNSQQWDGFGHLTDHLDSLDWGAAFLTHWGWREDPMLLKRECVDLRAVLRRVVETIAAGQELAAVDLAVLNAVLSVPLQRMLRGENDTYQLLFEPLEPSWAWVKAQIVASLGDFLVHGQRNRLKTCANPGCRWAFYDETNGNLRRWCKDRTCGNRDKVRRYRRRKRA